MGDPAGAGVAAPAQAAPHSPPARAAAFAEGERVIIFAVLWLRARVRLGVTVRVKVSG